MIGLFGGIREIDLSFQERNGHTRITEDSNDDLLAIVASTIASDLTFVQDKIIFAYYFHKKKRELRI